MSLTDDDKRWIEQLIDARLDVIRGSKLPNPQDLQQFKNASGLVSRSRGTTYEPSIHSAHCRHCGMTYEQHKAYPHGACQDAVRQG